MPKNELSELSNDDLFDQVMRAAQGVMRAEANPDPALDVADESDPRARLPRIHIRPGTVKQMASQAAELLVKAEVQMFQSGGRLVIPMVEYVQAVDGTKTKSPALREIHASYLLGLLSQHIAFRQWNVKKATWIYADPPKDVVNVLLDMRGEWPFPTIISVMGTPTLRYDGTVLSEPGFDTATGIYLIDPPRIRVPTKPTKADAQAALGVLRGLLEEFPFLSETSRSVGLSALITPVVRAALNCAPMHGISASAPGSGKSHLINTAATITTGFRCPVIAAGRTRRRDRKTPRGVPDQGQPHRLN